jgi:hypothetical protein
MINPSRNTYHLLFKEQFAIILLGISTIDDLLN